MKARALTILVLLAGCEPKGAGKQVGPLKDWIVGTWVRTDDRTEWEFKADGEMATTGRMPIVGAYGTEEPDKVEVRVSGANGVSAGMTLGIKTKADETLIIKFAVKDDEMRPVGINSTVVFRKK